MCGCGLSEKTHDAFGFTQNDKNEWVGGHYDFPVFSATITLGETDDNRTVIFYTWSGLQDYLYAEYDLSLEAINSTVTRYEAGTVLGPLPNNTIFEDIDFL